MGPQRACHRPIYTEGMCRRAQIDIVDLSTLADDNDGYKYLVNYCDHGIKLYDNRPLRTRTAMARVTVGCRLYV